LRALCRFARDLRNLFQAGGDLVMGTGLLARRRRDMRHDAAQFLRGDNHIAQEHACLTSRLHSAFGQAGSLAHRRYRVSGFSLRLADG